MATVIFCAGFLFFYREGNIFGIQYISRDNVLYARSSGVEISDIETIKVDSYKYDVYIKVNPSVSTVVGAMRNKVFGYAKMSSAVFDFKVQYEKGSKTLIFDSVQPRGWLNSKDSYIEIAIPESLKDTNINITSTTSKADVNIGGDKVLNIASLDVTTKSGDVVIKNVNIANKIKADIGSGIMYIDEKCATTDDIDCILSVGSGTINFTKFNVDNFVLGTTEIKKNAKGKIGILKTSELITVGNINGGGLVQVGEVSRVDFESKDTDVAIDCINGEVTDALSTSRIVSTGLGDVKINSAKCNLEIDAHNGNIYLNTCLGVVNLITNQGDIRMDNAFKMVSASTAYGNININYSDAAPDYMDSDINDSNKNRAVVATTKNGHISISGLQNGYIEAQNKGRISLKYDKVVGTNKISANIGAVNIVVPNPALEDPANIYAFNLSVASEVNSDIKVGVVGSIGNIVDYNGRGSNTFTNIYNNAFSTNNNLEVSSVTGKIKIRSADLVGY